MPQIDLHDEGGFEAMFESFAIGSPKRNPSAQTGWEGFFPYYAGFSESFAKTLLKSARLPDKSLVLDPWNGSGTTTFAATTLGIRSVGLDLNPAMVLVAKARVLPSSEADSIEPLGAEILEASRKDAEALADDDPLRLWFTRDAAMVIRSIERSIRVHLLGRQTLTPTAVNLDKVSGLAATNYVALFSICREFVKRFRSSNPTWLRQPAPGERRNGVRRHEIERRFLNQLRSIAKALEQEGLTVGPARSAEVKQADTSEATLAAGSVDFVLTSPPYCTRIDYTVATRIELAVLHPLLTSTPVQLGRRMTGSTRVPAEGLVASPVWGSTCQAFLERVRTHSAKASSGYYYRTHLDYFDKMSRSLGRVASALKTDGRAIIVVQDSFYKDVHNDLATMLTEICASHHLTMGRRDDFHLRRSMAGINPRSRLYKRPPGAVESVLCFHK